MFLGAQVQKNLYSRSNIDWSNVDLFWGDERFVSKNSKNSNYKLQDLLIFDKKNIFPYNTEKHSNK